MEIIKRIDEEVISVKNILISYVHLHGLLYELYEFFSIYNVLYLCFVNQFTHEIVSEYGTNDLNMLQEKLRKMRILENIELPDSVVEFINNTVLADDPIEEIDVDDNDIKATENKDNEEENDDDDGEEEGEEDEVGKDEQEEDDGEELVVENKKEWKFEVDPNLPMMVRMANLCVVGGFSVNGVAEIHSEIVKEEVFNEFYEVSKISRFFLC